MVYHDVEADNISVGSLGVLDVVEPESKQGRRRRDSWFSDEVDDQDLNDSLAVVYKLSRSVDFTKTVILIYLVLSAVLLSVSAYFVEVDRSEDDDEDSGSTGTHSWVVGIVFFLQILLFLRYEYLVTRRQAVLMDLAQQSKTIVDSLFPSVVRERLLKQADQVSSQGNNSDHDDDDDSSEDIEKLTKMNTLANKSGEFTAPPNTAVRTFLAQDGTGITGGNSDQPIASHYPSATVFFADIAGFTAWSTGREPNEVFTLLETVYAAFDELADVLRVFKVETIGDCYMAVTGLPEPDDAHALNMAKFAYQCVTKMGEVTDNLESILGSDTRALDVRAGLHSGPVTAGVLRGQKSRFQLFGDTVNTASRMESTGEKGRIQVSEETANLLVAAGKSHWVKPRKDKIVAKGKGELQTFWLDPAKNIVSPRKRGYSPSNIVKESPIPIDVQVSSKRKKSSTSRKSPTKQANVDISESPEISVFDSPTKKPTSKSLISPAQRNLRLLSEERDVVEQKHARLIQLNSGILFGYLEAVMTCRHQSHSRSAKEVDHSTESGDLPPPVDLVADVIMLPDFDANARRNTRPNWDALTKAEKDLQSYVTEIALLYNNVPFHNFEHASHVTLATDKLLQKLMKSRRMKESELHMRSFGISSDPLTQFALVFAAIVHDVGHIGVPNSQLVEEKDPVALLFKNQSVAEQNSITIAWQLLLEPRYQHLRSCIYRTNVERKRFRQVLINAVLASDISDRSLHQQRAKRWTRAFGVNDDEYSESDQRNRKATMVIENMIQMADVAHTMQLWSVYRKWNDWLFEEMLTAHCNGRASWNPTETWYRGEMSFFDFYVIPLVKRMKETGVFGEEAGQLYLSNAQDNRNRWEMEGQRTLDSLIRSLKPLADKSEHDGIELSQMMIPVLEDSDEGDGEPSSSAVGERSGSIEKEAFSQQMEERLVI